MLLRGQHSMAVSESNKNRVIPYQSDLTDMNKSNSKIRENETNSKLADYPNNSFQPDLSKYSYTNLSTFTPLK